MSNKKILPRYKDGYWLTKDNKFIRIKGNMTSQSYKITNYFLFKAMKENSFDEVNVTLEELRNALQIKTGSIAKILNDESEKIMKTIILIESKNAKGNEEENEWDRITLIPHMTYQKGIATAKINPDILPYMKGLKGNFTNTDYKKINECGSYAAMRLAEICNSWSHKGRAYYSVEEWRGLLGAVGKSYDDISQFRKRILRPAIDTINECMDFTVTPIEHKKGRITTHIEMIIKSKFGAVTVTDVNDGTAAENQDEAKVLEVISPQTPVYSKPYQVNKKEQEKAKQDFANLTDFEQSVVNSMVEKYDLSLSVAVDAVVKYGISHCTKQMDFVRKSIQSGHNIANKGGYLRKALEESFSESHEAMEEAKAREEEAIRNNKLWDKQAKEFFYGKTEQKNIKTPEELAYERQYELWSKQKNSFRAELIKLAKDGKIELSMVTDALLEFDQKNPPPTKPKEKESDDKKDMAKSLITQLMESFSMPSVS